MPEPWPVTDERGDYIFRFSLDPERHQPVLDGALAELMRSQLDELLKLVVLTYQGQRVRVDGFRFLSDAETTYRIWGEEQG
jgi:hypothetical protein